MHQVWLLQYLDPSRDVIGALTISGPTQRFTRDTIEKYAREVVTSAHEISTTNGIY